MSKVNATSLLVTILPLAVVIACGGGKPEPSVASSAPTETTPSPGDASATAPSTPEPTSSVTPAPTPSVTDAGAAPPPSPPVTLGETKDECTPVGVDFEKRARPKLKDCYAEGKKKTPNLEGTVKIKITVDVKGKIKSTKIVEKTLPDPVAQCMLKVIKATPFPEVDKCWDATLTIPITFPSPR
jgi:hypothetical protein